MLHFKIKLIFVCVICSLSAYLILFHVMAFHYLQKQKQPEFKVKLDRIIVHLDLKGSPPKLSYLKSLMPMLKEYNVNGFLVEYEDMFPYDRKLQNLSARNAYSKEELENFLHFAVNSGFEIIPLIQTFGHLEFALKLAEFKHLRETPEFPDSLCPSKLESVDFLNEMLEQVITFHTRIAPLKHIHIGCDEVYHMNSCNHCLTRNLNNMNLFIEHIEVVSKSIKYLSPDTTVLIWNDMLGKIIPDSHNHLRFPNIIPVYWDYNSHDVFKEGHKMMYILKWIFGRTWAATAFKGADGPARTMPDMKNRFVNHYNWLMAISKFGIGSEKNFYKFEGIILTGWSRYSHMQSPCELLPASIPSLLLNLILIQKFRNGLRSIDMDMIFKELNAVLRCRNNNFSKAINCQFVGSDLYDLVHKYIDYEDRFSADIGSRYETKHFERNTELKLLQRGYINMAQMPNMIEWCDRTQSELFSLESEMIEVMSKYFDKYCVEEYVLLKLDGMKKDLEEVCVIISKFMKVQVWPRRPSGG